MAQWGCKYQWAPSPGLSIGQVMSVGGANNNDDAVNDKHIHDGVDYKGHNLHCHQ